MSDFVLDASISLAWFIDDPVPALARRAKERLLKGETALVPALWLFEVGNGFVTAERRRLITSLELTACCDELEVLLSGGLEVAAQYRKSYIRDLTASAGKYSLTGYDASYLELALREGLPLVTLDRTLQAAAKKAGLPSFS